MDFEPTISIFFENERTYVTLFEHDGKGVSLAYINSTTLPLDFSPYGEGATGKAYEELQETLMEIAGAATRVCVSISMDNLFVHQFPAASDISPEELNELLRFGIEQNFPGQDLAEYSSDVYLLHPKLDASQMALAATVEKQLPIAINEALSILGAEVERVEGAQFAVHNAYAYNYPEQAAMSAALFGVNKKFVDVSVLRDKQIAYYRLAPFNGAGSFGADCQAEIEKILDEYAPFIDKAYFFGSHLNKALYDEAQAALSIPTARLSAFRMCTTTLGDRERAYCSRVGHTLAPCVGAALAPYQQPIAL